MADTNLDNASAIPRAVMNAVLLKDKLNICHLNVQSLCARRFAKFAELNHTFMNSKVDIICMTETWLSSTINDSMIAIDGYHMFRNDRNRHGGGICIYFKRGLDCRVIGRSTFSSSSNMMVSETEYLLIEILVGNDKVLLVVYYNPPNVDCSESFRNHVEQYSLRYKSTFFIGDFNTDPNKHNSRSSSFTDVLASLSYSISNSEPTFFYQSGCSLLDLLISDTPASVLKFGQTSMPGVSKHDLIFASLDFSVTDPVEGYWYRDYYHFDDHALRCNFLDSNWNNYFSIDDPDILCNIFTNILHALHEKFFPKKFKKLKANPWFTVEIEWAIINRNIAYHNWKIFKTDLFLTTYKRLRNRVTTIIRNAKRSHDMQRFNINLPSKELWNNVKKLGLTKKSHTTSSIDHPADAINDFFCSNFTAPDSTATGTNSDPTSFRFSEIQDFEIINAAFAIKSNAMGIDEIPIKFIRILLPFALPVLSHLFNSIIYSSVFPSCWKKTKVIPIEKKSGNKVIANLRPISLLCSCSKILEKLLHKQISVYTNRMNFLHKFQSGFRSRHSTETALIKVHDDIARAMDKKLVTVLLLLDFSKAFDRVSHGRLINKLITQFNFSTSAAKLIQNYLSGRSQAVFVKDGLSTFHPILSGVPQGSILGPLLFSLFINDLPCTLDHSNIHLFADDVQIYLSTDRNSNLDAIVRKLNHDLSKVYRWSQVNLLALNADKTKGLLISRSAEIVPEPDIFINNDRINFVERAVNLGMIFSNDFDWSTQINSQCGKIYAALKQLSLTTRHFEITTKIRLFKSLILPHFTYGCFIYSNATNLALGRLRVALNACVRYVYSLSRYSRVSHLQKTLIGCPFENFYKYQTCCIIFKIVSTGKPEYLASSLNPLRNTRTRSFIIPRHSSAYYNKSIFAGGIAAWNQLPASVKTSSTFVAFKRSLLAHLTI